MSARHTPGPWVVFKEGESMFAILPAGREGDIAVNVTGYADARLIAAAPALADALLVLRSVIRYVDSDALASAMDEADEALRAAGRLP